MHRDQIIPAIARRDPAGWASFDREFRPAVFAIALRMVRNPLDAEEGVQDVALSVHRHAASFRGDSDPWRWVHRITRNTALTLTRRRRNDTTWLEPGALEAAGETSPGLGSPPRPDELLDLLDMTLRIEAALAAQEPLNQSLFTMMDVQGRSKEEAAAALGLSVPALKARLHRIRLGLRAAAHSGPSLRRAA